MSDNQQDAIIAKTQMDICINHLARLEQALERQTAALKYLADIIGFGLDALQQRGVIPETDKPRPKQQETDAEKTPPAPTAPAATPAQPAAQPTPAAQSEPTIEDVRAAMNDYARRAGKNAALALIDRYSATRKVEDVDPAQYGNLLMEAKA